MDVNNVTKIIFIICILYLFYYFPWYTKLTPESDVEDDDDVNIAGNLPIVQLQDWSKYGDPVAVKNLSCYYGLVKCPTGSSCDCYSLCKSEDFNQVHVDIGQDAFYKNKKLEEGFTYCLPNYGSDDPNCQKQTQVLMFTSTGFRCINKYPHIINDKKITACITKDGSTTNPLWDYKFNKEVQIIGGFNPYEIMNDGKNRYGCKCKYNDDMGNKTKYLPELDPFSCFEDPCLSNNSKTAAIGFLGGQCNCKPIYVDPETKRCTSCTKGIDKSFYNCAALDSTFDKAQSLFICPPKFVEDSKQLCVSFDFYVTRDIDWSEMLIQ